MNKALTAVGLCFFVGMVNASGPYPPDEKGFIRDWLLGGPYPSYWIDNAPSGYVTDFLGELGGEAQAAPEADLVSEAEFKADKAKLIAGIGSTNEWGYKETKTFPVRWRELHWDKPDPIISLDGLFVPLEDHIVAYAFCYVESPERRDIKVHIGSDDDHKVWLNSKLLGGVNKSQGVVPDSSIYPARLERGLNRLLLKVVDRTHGHGFCLALSDRADKPLTDVQIRLEHPRRELLSRNPCLRRVDAWDRGFHAGFSLAGKSCFVGPNNLSVQVGVPTPGKYGFALVLLSQEKTILTEERTAELKGENELVEWEVTPELPAGLLEMRVTVRRSGESDPAAILSDTVEVIDLEAVKAENIELANQIARADETLGEVRDRQKMLERSVKKLQCRRRELYAETERAYAEKRRGLRSDPPAVDEPVKPATVLRRRICLNGDQWLGAIAAKSENDVPPVGGPPADTAWQSATLPVVMFNQYFRTWHYPLRNVDRKNPYGKVEPLPGWPETGFNPLICEDHTWFRKTLCLSATEVSGACTFVCENVSGKLAVYLNGVLCGEFFGNIGIVKIPLAGMREGDNALDLHLVSPRAVGIPQGQFTTHWGLRGDLFLDISAPIAVAETEVKTSWRGARIVVSTEVENRGVSAAHVRLEQYCVLSHRIRYRFPSRTAEVPPGERGVVENAGIWTEAETWGIGGIYGDPVLYDLVTDVYLGENLVDRHVTPFGFREFWIAGTDFYLNGHRIILQGDVGLAGIACKKLEVLFPLLRADGINTIRVHDSDHWSPEFCRTCDRLGMLAYAQMYPILHEKKPQKNKETGKRDYIPYDDWLQHPLHAYNLRNYERWVRMLRNHPSVVIASTDNEIFTQAWDQPESEAFNIRNDRLGAFYGRYVKSLDPTLIITRDGDEGTWGHKGKWYEEPPCDTANYHYPDFNIKDFVLNWQTVYDFRPAVFGETLYCSYGAWDNWIGAIPSQVQKKAGKVRQVASLYRELGIPGQIYMGLSSDGFIQIDDTGKGNPWGVTASVRQAYKEKGVAPDGFRYPWMPVSWPSRSGPGMKMPAVNVDIGSYGHKTVNWFDANVPSHVRNAVNEAYRESLLPMPSLAESADAECIIQLGAAGRGKTVVACSTEAPAVDLGVVADEAGTAWFRLPGPGRYTFTCDGQSLGVDVPSRANYAAVPGFARIPQFRANFAHDGAE